MVISHASTGQRSRGAEIHRPYGMASERLGLCRFGFPRALRRRSQSSKTFPGMGYPKRWRCRRSHITTRPYRFRWNLILSTPSAFWRFGFPDRTRANSVIGLQKERAGGISRSFDIRNAFEPMYPRGG